MTGITAITRDFGDNVNIVRITTGDNIATVTTMGYITSQATNISLANNGPFTWLASDTVLVYCSDGWVSGSISSDFTSINSFVFNTTAVGTPYTVGNLLAAASTGGNLEQAPGYNINNTNVLLTFPSATTITAHSGGGQTSATALTKANNNVTTVAAAGDSVKLPATVVGLSITITNSGANSMQVFGTSPDTINGVATGTGVAQLPGVTTTYTCYATGNWVANVVANPNPILFASIPMTAAQFNGMYAAPFQLIAAPGANKLIAVESMELIMTFVSADYASGGVVAAQYDSTVHGAGVLATNSEAAADFFAAASTTFQFIRASGNTVGALPFSTTVNKGLYLSNATGPFTTGDSTWVVKVYYRIVNTVGAL